jgi:two-component system response regulator AtoC
MTVSILCIDDDLDFLTSIKFSLKNAYTVYTASSISEAIQILENTPIDLALLDVGLGKENGIEGIKKLKNVRPQLDVVMLSGMRDPKAVVESIRAGAFEYLTKPFDKEELDAVVEKLAATWRVRDKYDALLEEREAESCKKQIIHTSSSVRRLLDQTTYLKGRNANVLIIGESGTGKELLARHIYRLECSKRRPFVAVNCAAIPENLLEAELFGYEPGAFTGAVKRRIGKFELADGGDIFLDEISSLKPEMQAKILRILEEREFNRVGGNQNIHADFRVIAASNESLEELVARGEFRMDLYHRLRVIELKMPALRERREDIPLLVEEFLRKFSDGKKKTVAADAMDKLVSYQWPGNVRELQNVIHSLVILTPGDTISSEHLPEWSMNGCGVTSTSINHVSVPTSSEQAVTLKDYVRKAERSYIEYVLDKCDGDKTKTAQVLDVGRTTLYGKMKELDMM